MIKTSKKNNSMLDFSDMMNEVEQDMERQNLEQSIVDRVPDLQQLSANIEKAIIAVINAMLSLERTIEQYNRAERKLDTTVTDIRGKVDAINEHIDEVMKDAPAKLHVSVSVSDPDMQKIRELFDKEHKWMIAQMQAHIQAVNTMLVLERKRVRERYKECDGCYLGHYAQWFVWFFFTIGISVVAGGIAMLIAQHCVQ